MPAEFDPQFGPIPKMLLTMKDAGKVCSVCAKTIYLAIKDGELVATRIGRAVRVTPQALAEWIAAKSKPSKAAPAQGVTQ